jgi:hypothetical protein
METQTWLIHATIAARALPCDLATKLNKKMLLRSRRLCQCDLRLDEDSRDYFSLGFEPVSA